RWRSPRSRYVKSERSPSFRSTAPRVQSENVIKLRSLRVARRPRSALQVADSDEDRQHIQNEIDQLLDELTRIAESTEFNTMPLLDGSFTGKRIHVGANAGQYIEVSIGDMRAGALGMGELSVLIREDADAAIGLVDDAIRAVSSQRSSMGALQNRLEHTINNLATTAENLQAAESRIRDADIAQAMMEFVRYQILTQVSVAVMAQARASAQAVLRLLWP